MSELHHVDDVQRIARRSGQQRCLARQPVGGQPDHPTLRNHRHIQVLAAEGDQVRQSVESGNHALGAGPEHALA
jgi:hypothetical protein